MTLARPMFPPRADSTHAFSCEPVSQQRKRQKAIQRVYKLRQKASDEIERLIAFLDASDPYAATELEEAVDDGLCDEDSDAEPMLGSFDRMLNQAKAWCTRDLIGPVEDEAEFDDCDREEDDPAELDDTGSPIGTAFRNNSQARSDDHGETQATLESNGRGVGRTDRRHAAEGPALAGE